MRWPSLAALLLAACDAAPAPVAEATECVIPASLDVPERASQPDRRPDPPTAAYVLALSWSPEFCRFRADQPQHAGQCRDNRFGFIVHGLWPQGAKREHPRACALAPPVSEALAREHYCMTPSVRLMQDQWAAHGTCGFENADAYFTATAKLWDGLIQPDLVTISLGEATAGDVRDAFTAANPTLPRAAILIDRNNRGWLEEVRLCLDRALAYAACKDRGAPDEAPVAIWRGG